MENLRYVGFNSTKRHGQMNTNQSYYPEALQGKEHAAERKAIMKADKEKIASEIGFDYKKIFIPIQKSLKNDDKYEDGHTLALTKGLVETYENLYDFDYYADIVKLTRETPFVAVANNMADCANVMAVNTKTQEAVMAHCGGEHINRNLPMQAIDALGGNEKDIQVYVSPFAHTLTYVYGQPTWISDENIWNGCLTEENGVLLINQLQALKKQLLARKIPVENIEFSPFDTTKSPEFYSNSNAFNGVSEDAGRFISGVVMVPEKEFTSPYVKVFR